MNSRIEEHLKLPLEKAMTPEAKIFGLTEWYRLMLPYIPMVNGILMANVSIQSDGIHFKSPQAHYLYEGILYVDPVTKKGAYFDPKTGRFWSRKNVAKIPSASKLNYNHEQHPLACAHWGRVAAEIHGTEITAAIAKYLKR